jgi:hypothetical protein
MTIAGMKRYLHVLNEPGRHLHGSRFVTLMDRAVQRLRLEKAYPGANHIGVRRGRRIFGEDHLLLSWPGRAYIALQQPGAGNCTGA